MVCKTLFALCIFTAGLRVQSEPVPTSTLLPISLPAKITPLTPTWTSSPQNTAAVTTSPDSGSHSSSVPPVPASAPTSPLPKNSSIEPKVGATSPALNQEVTDVSFTGLSSTTGGVHFTPTSPEEHGQGTAEASVPTTGSQSPAEPSTVTSTPAPASSPSSLSVSPPEISSVPVTSNHSSTATNIQPTGAPTAPASPTEEHSSGHTPTSHATVQPESKEKTPQATVLEPETCELMDTTTASPVVIMQEVEHALSSGSIAAITVTVIAVVLLVFGVAAYLKIRHSSYGRLLDDHDYGSWGNYNNPLYDDS